MKVYFAADHAGFALKNELLNFVRGELGYEVEDCGAYELDAFDDYPDIIAAAARKLSHDALSGADSRAVILGASGQGEAMAANRFKGVRAAVYYGAATRQTDASGHNLDLIQSVRAHNDANAIALGARFVGETEAKDVVRQWLTEVFSHDERHTRRIARLDTLS